MLDNSCCRQLCLTRNAEWFFFSFCAHGAPLCYAICLSTIKAIHVWGESTKVGLVKGRKLLSCHSDT